MKKLDALLKQENNNLPLTTRHTKEELAKYVKDLQYVLKRVSEGVSIPAIHELKAYIQEEHGINVAEGTIRTHLRKLAEGKNLWPKS